MSIANLRAEVLQEGLVASTSETTIWRWLGEDPIRPWSHRNWVFPRDPHFAVRAGRVLDLYAREWQGQPLGRRGFVLYADEKTSIQARVRTHPTTPPGPGRAMQVDTVMTSEPYASATRVFWVVDNGSSHRGPPSIASWPFKHDTSDWRSLSSGASLTRTSLGCWHGCLISSPSTPSPEQGPENT